MSEQTPLQRVDLNSIEERVNNVASGQRLDAEAMKKLQADFDALKQSITPEQSQKLEAMKEKLKGALTPEELQKGSDEKEADDLLKMIEGTQPTPTQAAAPNSPQQTNTTGGKGGIAMMIERVGEFTDKIGEYLSRFGSSSLLTVANFMESAGGGGMMVNMLRKFAGSEKVVLREQLTNIGYSLVPDISVHGKMADKAATNELRRLFATAKAARAATASAVPYTFEEFVGDTVAPRMAKKQWNTKERDGEGHVQVTLRDVVDVLAAPSS